MQSKIPSKVLLDHDWPINGTIGLHLAPVYQALKPLKDQLQLYQAIRFDARAVQRSHLSSNTTELDNLPSWITPIPQSALPAYMEATKDVQTFVVTHPGSYNHAIVDMAVRGTHVVALHGVVAPQMVVDFEVTELADWSQLVGELQRLQTVPNVAKRKNCKDMADMIAMMIEAAKGFKR
jgi:hypothetical protein